MTERKKDKYNQIIDALNEQRGHEELNFYPVKMTGIEVVAPRKGNTGKQKIIIDYGGNQTTLDPPVNNTPQQQEQFMRKWNQQRVAVSKPLAMGATALAGGAIFAPLLSINPTTAFVTGVTRVAPSMIAGEGLNRGSKKLTGRTWGENVNHYTGMPTWLAEFTNPGYYLGGSNLVVKPLEYGIAKTFGRASNIGGEAAGRYFSGMLDKGIKKTILPTSEPLLNVGWAPKQIFKGYHASNESEFAPDFWKENWAVREHGAPHGFYVAQGEKPTSGFLTKRPYVYQTETVLEKPMVQVGEVSSTGGKNATRNAIERQAQEAGADGIIYQGIKDNQMSNQTIMKTLNPDTKVNIENNLTSHVQGDEAVKMFKEYGGEAIPEGSINGEQLRKYVAEARERYGLQGNKNITDEEIAQALYKHSKELGGNTAAVNAQGEPQLLFRGDTKRFTELKERMSPEELSKKSGTMDNSLGNLFLGELPGTAGKVRRGLERYLVTGRDFRGVKTLEGSGTGSKAIMPDGTLSSEWGQEVISFPEGSYPLVTYNHRAGPLTYYKYPQILLNQELMI